MLYSNKTHVILTKGEVSTSDVSLSFGLNKSQQTAIHNGKVALVVVGSNPATVNIYDKLKGYWLDFLFLGRLGNCMKDLIVREV